MDLVRVKIKDGGAIVQLTEYPKLQGVAILRGINRTLDWCRTRTLDAITGNLAIKRSDLDGQHRFGGVTVRHATQTALFAVLNVTGNRIPLYRFAGKPDMPPKGQRQHGVTYRIDQEGGHKRIRTNAFVAVMKSGHIGFFRRAGGASRGRLLELFGPSVPHAASNRPEFKRLLEADAGARLELQISREVNFILTGSSKGASE